MGPYFCTKYSPPRRAGKPILRGPGTARAKMVRMRDPTTRIRVVLALAVAALAFAGAPARAKRVVPEFFAGGGVAATDYSSARLSTISSGLGLRFLGHLALGGKGYFDRQHNFYTGYAALYLFPDGDFGVFGRGELGRRNDRSDVTAVGWAAGVFMGSPGVRIYLEVGGFTEPGYVDGVQLGVLFHGGARLR